MIHNNFCDGRRIRILSDRSDNQCKRHYPVGDLMKANLMRLLPVSIVALGHAVQSAQSWFLLDSDLSKAK